MATKGGKIHYYRHVSGYDLKEAEASLEIELRALLPEAARFEARKVREIGPRYIELVADIYLP